MARNAMPPIPDPKFVSAQIRSSTRAVSAILPPGQPSSSRGPPHPFHRLHPKAIPLHRDPRTTPNAPQRLYHRRQYQPRLLHTLHTRSQLRERSTPAPWLPQRLRPATPPENIRTSPIRPVPTVDPHRISTPLVYCAAAIPFRISPHMPARSNSRRMRAGNDRRPSTLPSALASLLIGLHINTHELLHLRRERSRPDTPRASRHLHASSKSCPPSTSSQRSALPSAPSGRSRDGQSSPSMRLQHLHIRERDPRTARASNCACKADLRQLPEHPYLTEHHAYIDELALHDIRPHTGPRRTRNASSLPHCTRLTPTSSNLDASLLHPQFPRGTTDPPPLPAHFGNGRRSESRNAAISSRNRPRLVVASSSTSRSSTVVCRRRRTIPEAPPQQWTTKSSRLHRLRSVQPWLETLPIPSRPRIRDCEGTHPAAVSPESVHSPALKQKPWSIKIGSIPSAPVAAAQTPLAVRCSCRATCLPLISRQTHPDSAHSRAVLLRQSSPPPAPASARLQTGSQTADPGCAWFTPTPPYLHIHLRRVRHQPIRNLHYLCRRNHQTNRSRNPRRDQLICQHPQVLRDCSGTSRPTASHRPPTSADSVLHHASSGSLAPPDTANAHPPSPQHTIA